jgi:hypothetical protein
MTEQAFGLFVDDEAAPRLIFRSEPIIADWPEQIKAQFPGRKLTLAPVYVKIAYTEEKERVNL